MSDLNEIEQQVSALQKNSSSIFRFLEAFQAINDASKEPASNIDRLRNILSAFRGKLPNLLTHKRLKADARDLADNLMLATLDQRINAIAARNRAISNLTGALDIQINKGNSDAELLKDVKDAVDKVTKTVDEVKALIEEIEDPTGGLKSDLIALITRLANISSIFEPDQS
jgi:SRSO17 transposase